MISLSTVSVIFYVQFTIIISVLFLVWFFKNKKSYIKLQSVIETKTKMKQAFENLNKEYKSIKIELQNLDKITIFNELVNEELIKNRDKIDHHFTQDNAIDYAYILELRSAYLQLEKQWINIKEKDDEYWNTIYGELSELLKQNTLLNKTIINQNSEQQDNISKDNETEIEAENNKK